MNELALLQQADGFDLGEAFDVLVDEIGEKQALRFFADIAGYKKMPPTIEEFVTDNKYLGKFFRGGKGIYPIWLETLKKIYPHPLYSPYEQIILTGSIGQGKSTCALIGMLYDICRMLHMKDPHKSFMMSPGKKLMFAIFNTTLNAAQSVLMTSLANMIKSSSYFERERHRGLKRKTATSEKIIVNATIKIGPFIEIVCSSRDNHIRGEDVVSGILSEINFQGAAKKDQAINNYNELRSRIDSRFKLGEDFDLPGRCWCDSSRSDETGELERITRVSRTDPKTLMTEYPQWDVLGPAGKKDYKYLRFKNADGTIDKKAAYEAGEMFEIFIGDPKTDPFIIENAAQSVDISPDYKMLVPIEHLKEFQTDMFVKLRDLAGVATWSTYKFVYQERFILESCVLPLNGLLKQIIDLPFEHNAPMGNILDYLDLSKILDKKATYFIHMDYAAVNDKTGIGFTRNMGLADLPQTVRESNPNYTDYLQRLCYYQTDLVLYLVKQPGKEVPLAKIEEFLIALKRLGYNIGKFSADQYQSKHTLQVLPDRYQIPTEHVTVDGSRDPYDLWKRLMLNTVEVDGIPRKQWQGPNHPLLIEEFKELIDLGKKIEHPDPSQAHGNYVPSKDGADGVVGSLFTCYHDSTTRTVVSAAQQAHFKQVAKTKQQPTKVESIKQAALEKLKNNNNRLMT